MSVKCDESELHPWGEDGPEGSWTVTGARTPSSADASDGKSYDGTVDIQPVGGTQGNAWTCEYATSLGRFMGSGIFHHGLFLVGLQPSPWSRDKTTRPGVFWYTLRTDGGLEAVWNSQYSGFEGRGLGTGRATGGESSSILGSRQIQYFDALGNQAGDELNVVITARGSALELGWCNDDKKKAWEGAGLQTHDGLAAVFVRPADFPAMPPCSAPVSEEAVTFQCFRAVSENEAHGISTSLGSGAVGHERIHRVASTS